MAVIEAQDANLPLVLIFQPLHDAFYEILNPKFRFLKPWESDLSTDEFLAVHAADRVSALLCFKLNPHVDSNLLDKLPKLKCVITASAGVNHIDVAECRQRGIAVCNAGDIYSDNVADYAVGLLIDVLRRISASDRYIRNGYWPMKKEFRLGTRLGGKRVGIVGLGSIGSRIAKRLEAFGCIISYQSRTIKDSVPYKYFSSVHDLAGDSNVLILACALNGETHHMVDRDVMLALGKEGFIINVGRGPLIDEKEMIRCLMEEEIAGAGLDVFENEPNVPQELIEMDNVVLCHHRAASSPEAFVDLAVLVGDNLEAFFSNRPLVTPFSE